MQQNEDFVVNSIENGNINFCCHSFALLHTCKIISVLVDLIDELYRISDQLRLTYCIDSMIRSRVLEDPLLDNLE